MLYFDSLKLSLKVYFVVAVLYIRLNKLSKEKSPYYLISTLFQ